MGAPVSLKLDLKASFGGKKPQKILDMLRY